MVATKAYQASAFGQGFLEGYNTLDALASVAFSVIAVTTLNQLGFSSKREYIKTIWLVGIVVALGFSVLYIGLGYQGCMYYQKRPKRSLVRLLRFS